jgi:hypothetical protein
VRDLSQVDLTDLDRFAAGFPHDIFRLHRDQAPVWWHEPTVHTPDGEGFWSVATYDEVLQVLRGPKTYSSETGGDRPYGGTIMQDLPVAGVVLNMMDDPRHARIRRLVTKGLTPAAVRGLEPELRGRMRRLARWTRRSSPSSVRSRSCSRDPRRRHRPRRPPPGAQPGGPHVQPTAPQIPSAPSTTSWNHPAPSGAPFTHGPSGGPGNWPGPGRGARATAAGSAAPASATGNAPR